MKRAPKAAKVLLRCLNARQFGLKLIANVTYGYTAAGFSGAAAAVGQGRGKCLHSSREPTRTPHARALHPSLYPRPHAHG